jgi:hypothetical protein
MRLDECGNGVPVWNVEGFFFTSEDLAGKGMIAGFAVRCFTPELQVLCHAGYELPDNQLKDMILLHEKFGIDYIVEASRLRPTVNGASRK